MDFKLSKDIINQIKKFKHSYDIDSPLTEKEGSLIDKLIPNEELKVRYKEYGLCKECDQPNTDNNIRKARCIWCQSCNSQHFQQNFRNWTSGNPEIDEFIQDYQLKAINAERILEWIPYNKFTNIEYIAEGGFGQVYKARWIDGQIIGWNIEDSKWERRETIPNGLVALKILNNSQDIKADFLQEITCHKLFGSDTYFYDGIVRCHGISQDPKTQNYIMVMGCVPNGDIRKILKNNRLNFKDKLDYLYYITFGLKNIHNKGLIHRDFHSGNILCSNAHNFSYITDLGLCRPANEGDKGEKIYGVLPYVAPEVLRGKQYSQAADIYSWGIVAYEILSGLPPYHELAHEEYLALKICQGVRPKFTVKVPQLLKDLIMRCLDANPIIRPTVNELVEFLLDLRGNSELCRQYNDIEEAEEAEEFKEELSSKSNSLTFKTHPQAIYTSRLLDYKNLPEPQNSKEINEQFYNSVEYSKSLQIDVNSIQDI